MKTRMKKTWKKENYYLEVLTDNWYKLIAEINDEINYQTAIFYREKNIKQVNLPITTGSISSPMGLGSDSKPVEVNIFGVKTYLADSMQFMLEYAVRLFDQGGAYYIMPSFRGEDNDKRHLAQFTHSEVEIVGGLDNIINLAEEYIKFLCEKILKKFNKQILETTGTLDHIKNMIKLCGKIPEITFEEAVKLLKNDKRFIEELEDYRNITPKGELELLKIIKKEALWIKNYDYLAVPFYQAYSDDRKTALNADLILGIGETLGAGERHWKINELRESLIIHNVKEDEYNWYINMKKKYPLRTSGFGMGIERFLCWILCHDDIRDMQIIYRENGKNILP